MHDFFTNGYFMQCHHAMIPLTKDAKDRFVNFKYNLIEVVWIFNQYPTSKILMKKIQKKLYFFLTYILIFIDTTGHMIILLMHKTCIFLA